LRNNWKQKRTSVRGSRYVSECVCVCVRAWGWALIFKRQEIVAAEDNPDF
jgi:hypothetical protein